MGTARDRVAVDGCLRTSNSTSVANSYALASSSQILSVLSDRTDKGSSAVGHGSKWIDPSCHQDHLFSQQLCDTLTRAKTC
jgi:hypothetical protein